MALRVAFVAEGDAEHGDCWSGCARRFVRALRRRGVEVAVLDVEPRGWRRIGLAARNFHPHPRRWRSRLALGDASAFAKSAHARAMLGSLAGPFDAIIQAGATFRLPAGGAPVVVYADSNIAYARRGAPYSGASALDAADVRRIAARERAVYLGADRIWSWSDALARSFAGDFGVDAARIRTIYAGADVRGESPAEHRAEGPPSILFVGKDQRRKGLPLLLDAFRLVRAALPDAVLNVVGGVPAGATEPGVVVHGEIRGHTPAGRERLDELYRRATVFCMPSHYEPFGVVFVEAMLAALPCVGVARWAMPEIIAHGETGWCVPPDDPAALADRLIALLRDRAHAAAMGARGRARALDLFTWDRVAERAEMDLHALLGERARTRHEVSA